MGRFEHTPTAMTETDLCYLPATEALRRLLNSCREQWLNLEPFRSMDDAILEEAESIKHRRRVALAGETNGKPDGADHA